MADYNIYIRNETSESNPTTSWSSDESFQSKNPTTAWSSSSNKSQDRSVTSMSEMAGAAKAGLLKAAAPYAIAYLIYKKVKEVATKAINTYERFAPYFTGNYARVHTWQNIQSVTSALHNPLGAVQNEIERQLQIKNNNTRSSLNRSLLGDSAINSYHNRGV